MSSGMEFPIRCQQLCKMESRKLVIAIGIIATAILVFQSFALPSGNVFSSLLPAFRVQELVKGNFSGVISSHKPARLPDSSSAVPGVVKKTETSNVEGEAELDTEMNEEDPEEDFALQEDGEQDDDGDPNDQFSFEKVVDPDHDFLLENVRNHSNGFTLGNVSEPENEFSIENVEKPGGNYTLNNVGKSDAVSALENVRSPDNDFEFHPGASSAKVSDINSIDREVFVVLNTSSTGKQAAQTLSKDGNSGPLHSVSATSSDNSTVGRVPIIMKHGRPPITISEMNRLLLWNRVSSHSMKPQWSSACDRELLSAKTQIENSPAVKNDRELYSPVFRNVSMFKRSYELMERKLKVYVYKEGEKPIFHKPRLTGIYASEGWFMKLLEGNKQFVVKHPRKAHLFYLPFSSYVLRIVKFTPESHKRSSLVEYLKNYIDKIAAKYPFWNRTGGADHFLVACHDWAPYETRQHLMQSLRALCNADVSKDFNLGKDMSLPVTNVRSAQNPLNDLGGKLASQRQTLAFFAGNMHGSLRPILLQYWENKDPVMKIFGPMPPGVDGKGAYIQYMKTSKYCICPRGYEVHSPRVVEAIFYECVPVIISDNYVPPFFEVLDWEAFAVFIAEKDIAKLKDILLSIPERRYLTMQLRVKKVQQHFLWHTKPVKYDIFHMILHSVWFNRLHQLKT